MNIIELNKYIGQIARTIPFVHSYSNEDVYEYWNTGEIKYGSIVFSIKSSITKNNISQLKCLLYYGDRLMTDKSNQDQIYCDANVAINAIINKLKDSESVEIGYPIQIDFFEQKFADEIAGGYAQILLTIEGQDLCGFGPTDNEYLNEIHKKTHNINYGTVPNDIVDYESIKNLNQIKDKTNKILG